MYQNFKLVLEFTFKDKSIRSPKGGYLSLSGTVAKVGVYI